MLQPILKTICLLVVVYVFLLLFTGCSSDKAIVINAPPPVWVNKMEEFCTSKDSDVDVRTIAAITHHKFKCYGGFSDGNYSCEGYKLQYRVLCKDGRGAKLTYTFGNDEDIILEVTDKKEVSRLSEEKDFE